jgi:hypothetical protein
MEPLHKNITIISRTQNPSGSVDLVIKAIDGTIFNILNCLSPEKIIPIEQLIGAYEVTAEDGTIHHKKAIVYFNPDRSHDLELTEEEE